MTAPARVLASPDLSASVRELKLQLGAIQESVRPDRAPLPTGIAELDALLVDRGIPRGRLTEITGASGSGRTSMLRTLVTAAASGGRWVAYIDATRTLAPRDWAHVGSERAPLWIIRPTNAARATWCADLLLRSGAFSLVVMDGAPPLARVLGVRLTRLARDVGAAFVVTGERGGDATGSSVRIRLTQSNARSERTTTLTLEKGGKRRTIEVSYGRAVARRLCAHPEVPDRRGVAHPERPYVPAPSTPIITSYPDKSAAAKSAAKSSVASTAPRRKRSSAFVG
ncbi:MAG: ATPase domain-containing protein [Gemmatimonadota bacterium]